MGNASFVIFLSRGDGSNLPIPFIEEMDKKRIGIKYCGGCNPTYERAELVKKVQFLTGERFHFLHFDQKDFDGLLLIQGCERACAMENLNPKEIPHLSITKESELKKIINWLDRFVEKTDG